MNIGLREATLNFELIREIGAEGANSQVFIAHDKQFDAEIVIKRIPKKEFNSASEFYKEAKCLHASKHQNIVSINYSCEDDKFIYIAMPFYSKGSLESLLRSRFLTVREILKYSIDFLSGINHIHTKRLIHFDIKPTNILISESNEALVTDFGLTKFTNTERVAEQNIFYDYHKPPESLKTNKFTIQADIYQAGLTIYRLCNGTDIFKGSLEGVKTMAEFNNLISTGKFPDRSQFLPHIPQKLRNIIRKALQLNPSDRYNNVIEMLNELSKVNENLDWKYKILPNNHIWEQELDNKSYEISLITNGGMFDISSCKIMTNSGRRTMEHINCKTGLPLNKALTELKKILKSY
jgi:serine/threonine protein kinase